MILWCIDILHQSREASLPLRAALFLIVMATVVGAGQAQADDLIIFFHDRPPYSWRDDSGKLQGLVVDPAEQALKAASIPFKWDEVPSARQMETIKLGEVAACGLGWFKRPDREVFARFSAPVYRDKKMVIIARRDETEFVGNRPIGTFFNLPNLILLVKTGYSYGAFMDAKIDTLNPKRLSTSTDNLHMLDMIALDRADYMLMSAEEAEFVLKRGSNTTNALMTYPFQDAPEGEARHLMCTKLVPQDLLDRFNAALPIMRM